VDKELKRSKRMIICVHTFEMYSNREVSVTKKKDFQQQYIVTSSNETDVKRLTSLERNPRLAP